MTTPSARAWFVELLKRAVRSNFSPPPEMTLPQWADTYRRLSTSSGNIGGPWRTSRVEVARGPMMAVTEKGVRTITAKTCTQLLKTSLLENALGYFAHLDPCPMLLTQPKEDSVVAFSKERLGPMARATPVLANLLGSDRQRGGKDTLQFKQFPGGFLAMESAGSPSNLAMRAIRITLADEIDKYETTKEGDPITLLEERTSTYTTNSLHFRCCSPTWEETSRIDKSYNESDQRRAFVECPHCKYSQVLDFFKHVHWSRDEKSGVHFPMTATVFCESCSKPWTEIQRYRMMTTEGAIKWRQTRPFTCCGELQEPMTERKWKWDAKNQIGMAACKTCGQRTVSNEHAGFTVSKMYSPFITMAELAEKWILAKDDPETKQTFYNTQLGLAFAAQALRKIDQNALAQRAEIYPAPVPRGASLITVGVDVQPGGKSNEGRFEIETVAWGRGEESWSIDYEIIEGDMGRPEVWERLDKHLLKLWQHESGKMMPVRGVCIDSGGHNTQDVYQFCRKRIGRNVWAIKGASDVGGQWKPVWPVLKLDMRKTRKSGYRPVIIGVNAAKEWFRQKLLIEATGPGYAHFPTGRPGPYFDQLTSETLVVEKKGGFNTKRWSLIRGRANEALDCRVYAYAALCGLATLGISVESMADAIDRGMPSAPVAPPPEPTGNVIADTAMRLKYVLENLGAPRAAPTPRVVPPKVRRSKYMG